MACWFALARIAALSCRAAAARIAWHDWPAAWAAAMNGASSGQNTAAFAALRSISNSAGRGCACRLRECSARLRCYRGLLAGSSASSGCGSRSRSTLPASRRASRSLRRAPLPRKRRSCAAAG